MDTTGLLLLVAVVAMTAAGAVVVVVPARHRGGVVRGVVVRGGRLVRSRPPELRLLA